MLILYNLYRFVHFSVRVQFLLPILLLQCGKCTYDTFVYVPSMQVDICCFDKTGTLTSDDMVCHIIKYTVHIRLMWFYVKSITNFFLALLQEFCGVVGLAGSTDLEPDMSKVAGRTLEILASCHALVFVDNKLVLILSSKPAVFAISVLGWVPINHIISDVIWLLLWLFLLLNYLSMFCRY